MGDVAVIFGMQRCGSNYFLSVCHRLDDLLVLGEMYHRGGPFPFQQNQKHDFDIKQRLGGIVRDMFTEFAQEYLQDWDAGATYSPENDAKIAAALAKFSHKAPNRYFEALKQLAGTRRLLFKIFPEHLDLTQMLSILRDQRPKVILLLRNPLDSFISYKKLVQTQKPQDVDTSGLKIKFNKIDYFVYKSALANYFKSIQDFCDEEWLEVTTLHYEWLHDDASEDKLDKVKGYMDRVFGVSLPLDRNRDSMKLFTKQDKSASAVDKVTNPAELPRGPQYLL